MSILNSTRSEIQLQYFEKSELLGHCEWVLDVWPEFFSIRSLFIFCTIAYHLFALMNSCLIEVSKPHWPRKNRKRRNCLSFFAMRNIHHQPLIQRSRSLSYSGGIIKPTLVCVWRPHSPLSGLLTPETPNSWYVSSPGGSPSTDWFLKSSVRCCTVRSFIITDKFLLVYTLQSDCLCCFVSCMCVCVCVWGTCLSSILCSSFYWW